jgi:hypothetical protein
MKRVKVEAVREGRFWVLHLDDGGVTQVRNLSDAEGMVADYVSLMHDMPPEEVLVQLVSIDPGANLAGAVEDARRAQKQAAKAMEAAAKSLRRAALDMKALGLTGVEVSKVLGVSPQRVSQLTSAKAAQPVSAETSPTAVKRGSQSRKAIKAVPTSASTARIAAAGKSVKKAASSSRSAQSGRLVKTTAASKSSRATKAATGRTAPGVGRR